MAGPAIKKPGRVCLEGCRRPAGPLVTSEIPDLTGQARSGKLEVS